MRRLTFIPVALLCVALAASESAAETPIDYSYLDIEYGIDSTIEMFGGSFDSDDGLAVTASWQIGERWYTLARYATNGYDLQLRDKFYLEFLTAGAGYRYPIRQGETPIDLIVQITLEYHTTKIETPPTITKISDEGLGLRSGFRALITPHFEVGAFSYYIGYGDLPLKFADELDGLHFELTAALELSDRFTLVGTYLTGELDYPFLPGFEYPVQVEVDRDDLRLGLRFRF